MTVDKYLNPGNRRFQKSLNTKIYVDKSGLIEYTNGILNTLGRYVCVSRPRRFGKTVTASMLEAYYSRGCDSHAQFDGLKIARSDSYEKHINKYNVIHCAMTRLLSDGMKIKEGLVKFKMTLISNLTDAYPEMALDGSDPIPMLSAVYEKTKVGFVFIFDEWDCVFRERKDDINGQKSYLDFLRDLLKDQEYVALAYMTGILPIKKYGTHSALNMFKEISMTGADPLQEYMGFTEKEVKSLCKRAKCGRKKKIGIREWYNGYTVNGLRIYNPYAVSEAVTSSEPLHGYWTATETYEVLEVYIKTNAYGVQDRLVDLLSDKPVEVNTDKFTNDMVTFNGCDDVLTLLIHLGYLTMFIKDGKKYVRIPDREIREQFVTTMESDGFGNFDEARKDSEKVFRATLDGDAETVAKYAQIIHRRRASAKEYHYELSLKYCIEFAYLAAEDLYNEVLEMPAGDGFADVGYIPVNGLNAKYPPMIIELKVNKSAEGALRQAFDKMYQEFLSAYHGPVIVVGINYDEKTREHTCEIKRVPV
ncbi:MAG: AAA family ATPase [Clostridia bacterium]|nr:AAA family ATPase [Clostridia bacterium]